MNPYGYPGYGGYDDELLGYHDDLGQFPMRPPMMRQPMRPPARPPQMRARPMLPGPMGVRQIQPRMPHMPQIMSAPPLLRPQQGIHEPSFLQVPLGLGSHTFLDGQPTSHVFETNPQKPVRPRRLWIVINRSPNAQGIAVNVLDVKVGTNSMLGSAQPVSAEQFGPGAFSTSYQLWESAGPGLLITLSVAISAAPAAMESVIVTASLDCESIG